MNTGDQIYSDFHGNGSAVKSAARMPLRSSRAVPASCGLPVTGSASPTTLEPTMPRSRLPRRTPAGIVPVALGPDDSLYLDLLRGEMYRILDDLARSSPGARSRLFDEFERSWAQFREALDQLASHRDP